ncbi:hypothetical protein GQ42DRAFT_74776 [Ramicandelaber brevisporus]|nr:hypothetical protein GQ42DRAFT_74776 [Ramicandelaber brevisporus]
MCISVAACCRCSPASSSGLFFHAARARSGNYSARASEPRKENPQPTARDQHRSACSEIKFLPTHSAAQRRQKERGGRAKKATKRKRTATAQAQRDQEQASVSTLFNRLIKITIITIHKA